MGSQIRVITLGASGLIGRQLHRDAGGIGTYHSSPEADLKQFDLLTDDLLDLVPDLGDRDWVAVLPANVDPNRVAVDAKAARALNVEAVLRAMATARKKGAGVLFLSTEAVFGGTDGGYTESDEPVPLFEYARQKAEVEGRMQGGKWLIVRSGWTVGWNPGARCPVAAAYEALLSENAVMAEDNLFTLTDVADTSRALMQLMQADATGIYHVAANPPMARARMAEIIQSTSRFGGEMAFRPGRFADIQFTESRPAQAWISNAKFAGEFGDHFTSPEETVRKKIALLDAKQQKAERVTA